ncbi:uncharacterized protein M421DRAFT_366828 [Didymella exigua CBS 183.55]|uniref:Secreted protein n=1 Tax=Didymella exigua CBS 183.55 TaxID=1150837 RepID=A0A6A5R9A7_9PLEO|nr:uncharacterized protein M421DRAFT_366828 [Didymella exigua CBS 183.55]KAF1922407.1 hypothetical protein M421DRAFT_366828 [Didymella exigua CBS 183.55]
MIIAAILLFLLLAFWTVLSLCCSQDWFASKMPTATFLGSISRHMIERSRMMIYCSTTEARRFRRSWSSST